MSNRAEVSFIRQIQAMRVQMYLYAMCAAHPKQQLLDCNSLNLLMKVLNETPELSSKLGVTSQIRQVSLETAVSKSTDKIHTFRRRIRELLYNIKFKSHILFIKLHTEEINIFVGRTPNFSGVLSLVCLNPL